MNYKLGRGGLKAILDKATDMYKGSVFNYVDQNLLISGEGISLLL